MQISLKNSLKKYNIIPNGLIHIGINTGQEIPDYKSLNINNLICIDATKSHIEILKNQYPEIEFHYCAITDYDGIIKFNVASNNSESSSILDLKLHTHVYPDIKIIETINVPCNKLSTIIKDPKNYNIICMDIQGAELLALKGYEQYLHFIDMIFTEVNLVELYKNCVLERDLSNYLFNNGFTKCEFGLENYTWGDALYVRTKKLKHNKRL